MKNIFLYSRWIFAAFVCVIFFSPFGRTVNAQPSYTNLDTIVGRGENYWYTEWLDDCYLFYSDTADLFSPLYFAGGVGDGSVNLNSVVSEHRVPTRMAVKGLVAMVTLDDKTVQMAGANCLPSINPDRHPEYMRLLQGGDTVFPEYYTPHRMTLLDSVRWDTATPHIMKVPLNVNSGNDSSRYVYCYAYEAYFPEPVLVDTLFYISGSMYSDKRRWTQGPAVCCYYPTYYVAIEQRRDGAIASACDGCMSMLGLFHNSTYPYQELEWDRWFRDNRFANLAVGPFLPIVDYHTLTVETSDPSRGIVGGSGRFPDHSLNTVVAEPSTGYTFSHWSDGNTDNPRVVDLTDDMTLTAYFTVQ